MVDLNVNLLGKVNCGETEYNLAVETIKYAFKKGIKSMVIANKYISEEKGVSIKEVEGRVEKLNDKLMKNNINMKLYCAQNVQLSESNITDCLEGKVSTINNSKYMIVDLNNTMTDEQVEMVFELTVKGIVPIIAHPERYEEIIEKIERIEKLKEIGCLFQLDINSLKGLNGKKAKKIAKRLLKNKIYDVAASEVNEDRKKCSYSVLSKSERLTFTKNGLKILKNTDIPNHIAEPKIKSGLFKL